VSDKTPVRDHGFHALRVNRIVSETPDTCSVVFDIPPELSQSFAYKAGQNITFRVPLGGELVHRSYSMSSSPAVGDEFTVTVKRVEGGAVSNWVNDSLASGDYVDVTTPAGLFTLRDTESASAAPIVAFAGGSGITPIFAIAKTALATTQRPVRIFYGNRDKQSVIFDAELQRLAAEHPDRLSVRHHLDADSGYVTPEALAETVAQAADAEIFICGPEPFMDVVEQSLFASGVTNGQIHIERFNPLPAASTEEVTVSAEGPSHVTFTLMGKTQTAEHRPGQVLIQTARSVGLSPPFACEAGNCATCMAKLVEGAVLMHVNDALTEQEVAEGWILTCQSSPTTPVVVVDYDA
jgi:ferredoxin-NADP reductase